MTITRDKQTYERFRTLMHQRMEGYNDVCAEYIKLLIPYHPMPQEWERVMTALEQQAMKDALNEGHWCSDCDVWLDDEGTYCDECAKTSVTPPTKEEIRERRGEQRLEAFRDGDTDWQGNNTNYSTEEFQRDYQSNAEAGREP